jgi:hypothetical protein
MANTVLAACHHNMLQFQCKVVKDIMMNLLREASGVSSNMVTEPATLEILKALFVPCSQQTSNVRVS